MENENHEDNLPDEIKQEVNALIMNKNEPTDEDSNVKDGSETIIKLSLTLQFKKITLDDNILKEEKEHNCNDGSESNTAIKRKENNQCEEKDMSLNPSYNDDYCYIPRPEYVVNSQSSDEDESVTLDQYKNVRDFLLVCRMIQAGFTLKQIDKHTEKLLEEFSYINETDFSEGTDEVLENWYSQFINYCKTKMKIKYPKTDFNTHKTDKNKETSNENILSEELNKTDDFVEINLSTTITPEANVEDENKEEREKNEKK